MLLQIQLILSVKSAAPKFDKSAQSDGRIKMVRLNAHIFYRVGDQRDVYLSQYVSVLSLYMLPWQTKSILIIFQMPPKMLCFASICSDLPSISEAYFCPSLCHRNPKRGKMWQIDAVNRSKNVVEIECSYYRSFQQLFYHKNVDFSLPIFEQRKRPAVAERVSANYENWNFHISIRQSDLSFSNQIF